MQNGSRRAPGFDPRRTFTLVALLVALLVTFGLLSRFRGWDPVFAWLIGINMATFLICAYDWAMAPAEAARVPPALLLALTAIGGSIGAIVAFPLFRPRAMQAPFRWAWVLCVIISVNLVALYYVGVCPECR
jgi:uncharacterized membrane protein YsdA (DUF1294 family)